MLKKVIFMMMLLPVLSFADIPRGERLVNQLWKDMKEGNVEKIKEYTSKEFQSIHFFGAFNRFQQLDLIKRLNIQNYTLSNIKVTQGENVIIVTYFANVEQTIFEQTVTTIAPRLSVWKKYGHEWKWVAHANLRPILQSGDIMPE